MYPKRSSVRHTSKDVKKKMKDKSTDKKENLLFFSYIRTYKEIQKGSVSKSYMTNGLLIYG
jgi:hypothetical protein